MSSTDEDEKGNEHFRVYPNFFVKSGQIRVVVYDHGAQKVVYDAVHTLAPGLKPVFWRPNARLLVLEWPGCLTDEEKKENDALLNQPPQEYGMWISAIDVHDTEITSFTGEVRLAVCDPQILADAIDWTSTVRTRSCQVFRGQITDAKEIGFINEGDSLFVSLRDVRGVEESDTESEN